MQKRINSSFPPFNDLTTWSDNERKSGQLNCCHNGNLVSVGMKLSLAMMLTTRRRTQHCCCVGTAHAVTMEVVLAQASAWSAEERTRSLVAVGSQQVAAVWLAIGRHREARRVSLRGRRPAQLLLLKRLLLLLQLLLHLRLLQLLRLQLAVQVVLLHLLRPRMRPRQARPLRAFHRRQPPAPAPPPYPRPTATPPDPKGSSSLFATKLHAPRRQCRCTSLC